MALVKSVLLYKNIPTHLARFSVREERIYKKYIIYWVYPLFIAYAFVDHFIAAAALWETLTLRFSACLAAYYGYYLLRGRARYLTRSIVSCAPYYIVIQYIAIKYDQIFTQYMIGYLLIGFTHTIVFPVNMKFSLIQSSIYLIPTYIYLLYNLTFVGDYQKIVCLSVMIAGYAFLSSLCGTSMHNNLGSLFLQQAKIAQSLKKKLGEVDKLAKEIAKRKIFENQCSVQVAKVALENPAILEMREDSVVTLVFDIGSSTNRAFKINLDDYYQVISECTNIFSRSCMRANITVDKYIGDGVQAIAGAPVSHGLQKDINAAIRAVQFTETEIEKVRFELEQLWKIPLVLKYAITVGKGLVGFQGEVALKSYTAIGPWVSLCHRLCGRAESGEVAIYDSTNSISSLVRSQCEKLVLNDIKGVAEVLDDRGVVIEEAMSFDVLVLRIQRLEEEPEHSIGKCKRCGGALFLADDHNGIPISYATACALPPDQCLHNVDGYTQGHEGMLVS